MMMENEANENIQSEVIASEIPLAEFASKLKLSADKLSAMPSNSALVLPNNTSQNGPGQEAVYFHQDAKEMMSILKGAEIHASLYDDGREKRSIEWRSAEVVLPLLLFVGQKAMDGGLEAIGSWIVMKWLSEKPGRGARNPPTIKAQYAYYESGVVKEWISIEGPAAKVVEFLEKWRHGNEGANPPR